MNEIIAIIALLTVAAFVGGYTIGRAEGAADRRDADEQTEHGARPL